MLVPSASPRSRVVEEEEEEEEEGEENEDEKEVEQGVEGVKEEGGNTAKEAATPLTETPEPSATSQPETAN